jgi:hypothetical protein
VNDITVKRATADSDKNGNNGSVLIFFMIMLSGGRHFLEIGARLEFKAKAHVFAQNR